MDDNTETEDIFENEDTNEPLSFEVDKGQKISEANYFVLISSTKLTKIFRKNPSGKYFCFILMRRYNLQGAHLFLRFSDL